VDLALGGHSNSVVCGRWIIVIFACGLARKNLQQCNMFFTQGKLGPVSQWDRSGKNAGPLLQSITALAEALDFNAV